PIELDEEALRRRGSACLGTEDTERARLAERERIEAVEQIVAEGGRRGEEHGLRASGPWLLHELANEAAPLAGRGHPRIEDVASEVGHDVEDGRAVERRGLSGRGIDGADGSTIRRALERQDASAVERLLRAHASLAEIEGAPVHVTLAHERRARIRA